MKDENGIDVDAIRERYRGRIECAGHRRISLYAEIQRDAILVHSGVMPADQAHRDADLTRKPDLAEVAADFLRMAGMNVPPTPASKITVAMQMANNNIERGAHSTDNFTAWLGDTAQKSVTLGYEGEQEMWPFCTQQKSVPDFRQFDAVSFPEFPSPAETVENGEVPYMQLGTDSKESSALVSHTALFGITRQALLSGFTDSITTVPEALGRAANRAVGDKFFSVLAANAAMSDGNAFFSSAHGNLIAGGAAPSVTTLGQARALMTAQRGPSNSILNLRPAIVLGATILEETMVTLRAAMSDSGDDSLTPGFIAGKISVVTDARLDDVDAFAWYVLANPAQYGGISVFFLEGGELPLVEQIDGFTTDAVDYRLLHDFCVLATSYKSWVKNPGT
jgi:hypothetical protein